MRAVAPHPAPVGYDEMSAPDGTIRAHWMAVASVVDQLDVHSVESRRRRAAELLAGDGVTYQVSVDGRPVALPWSLDPLPMVIDAGEWREIEAGVHQRAVLLDHILGDLYGSRELFRRHLLPPEAVYAHPGFLRVADQIRLPTDRQLFLTATDIGRTADGRHLVISDRTQAPSGMGFALENRVVSSRVFPSLYREADVQRLAPFFRWLRGALERVAPSGVGEPRVVVLTPGPWSETSYEHAFLAAHLGYPLVQGADLRVRDGRVWLHTLGRPEPVHVVLRRVDAEWCDPLELLPESRLGAPGLVEAARLGTVSIVNPIGSGVVENPALMPFLPRLCEAVLGEPLRLAQVPTWWCGEPGQLAHVRANIGQLVIRPLSPAAGVTGPVVGAALTAAERDELIARIERHPAAWVAQEALALGDVPTLTDDGVAARRSVLRTFAVARGDDYAVMPGGLTRVGANPDELFITNRTGALSKDTLVVASGPEALTGFWMHGGPPTPAVEPEASMSSRAAENLYWMSRYAERAEGLLRLLRVVADRRNEFAFGSSDAGLRTMRVLLSAVDRTTDTSVTDADADLGDDPARPGLDRIVADGDLPGSLAFAVRCMLDAAAEVRDQLSIDTWLVIGHVDRDLRSIGDRLDRGGGQEALGRVLQGLLALAGLESESMVRDPGWHFMALGRRVERALQLCSLLDATITNSVDVATDSLVAESVLVAAESIITYRRRYRSRAQLATMLDLLLLDPDNPRSLRYQVDAMAAAVASLPWSDPAAAGPAAARSLVDEVARIDTASLAEPDAGGARRALAATLEGIDEAISHLAATVEDEHFTRQLPQQSLFVPSMVGAAAEARRARGRHPAVGRRP